MDMDRALLERALETLGSVLERRGLRFELVAVGGSTLMPAALGLPEGFEGRVETRRWGGLVLHVAGRFDQICFKLYAATDQGTRSKHFDDLRQLSPSREELLRAAGWARTHDPSEGFRGVHVQTLRALGVEGADAEV
jgi:hypothetical protein